MTDPLTLEREAATRRAHDLDRWQREAEQRVWRRPYRVTTTLRTITLMARTKNDAIRTGLELAGPGARLLSCLQEASSPATATT